jgi:hypothetical protein
MYVNAPDGHQVTAFDKYGDTMSIAHGTEVVRIGYGGYWSKIELYGMVRFVPSEYLSYEMPGWVETDVETDYGVTDSFEDRHCNVYPIYDIPVYNDPDEYSTRLGWVSAYKPVYVISENAMRGWYFIEFYDEYGNYKTGYIVSNPDLFDSNYSEESQDPSLPGEYNYDTRNETVYAIDSEYAIAIYNEVGDKIASIGSGSQLTRIGLSTDDGQLWSMIDWCGDIAYIETANLFSLN